ncbi:exodeoxyribonuclease III [Schaalia cardiffensis F0333]|uniref:Exodeoxyribonuclease III n=1 Tax=Schaalia cardiffensis F0333 TaxID=888050 RepID=N6WE10_9ACTO|nr:exodeoxyribonuclease III [Schaalia cardiffensis F0333]
MLCRHLTLCPDFAFALVLVCRFTRACRFSRAFLRGRAFRFTRASRPVVRFASVVYLAFFLRGRP